MDYNALNELLKSASIQDVDNHEPVPFKKGGIAECEGGEFIMPSRPFNCRHDFGLMNMYSAFDNGLINRLAIAIFSCKTVEDVRQRSLEHPNYYWAVKIGVLPASNEFDVLPFRSYLNACLFFGFVSRGYVYLKGDLVFEEE